MTQPRHEHRDERLSDLNDGQLVLRLWAFLRPHRRYLWVALFLYLPITAAMLLEPWLIGEAIDRYMKADGSSADRLSGVTQLGLMGLGVALVFAMSLGLQQLCLQRLGINTLRDLRKTAFAKALRLDLKVYDHEPVGRVMARMTNDIDSLAEVFAFGRVSVYAPSGRLQLIANLIEPAGDGLLPRRPPPPCGLRPGADAVPGRLRRQWPSGPFSRKRCR